VCMCLLASMHPVKRSAAFLATTCSRPSLAVKLDCCMQGAPLPDLRMHDALLLRANQGVSRALAGRSLLAVSVLL